MAGRQTTQESDLRERKVGEYSCVSVFKMTMHSKSKTFLAFCFCFIAGVSLFSLQENSDWQFPLFIAAFAALFFAVMLWQKKVWRFALLCALFFILGGLRFLISVPKITPSSIKYYNGEKMEVTAAVSEEPEAGISNVKYVAKVKSCAGQSFVCPKNISGKIIFWLPLYPRYEYGEELNLSCVLQEPKASPDGFRYDQYLARYGIWSVCGNPVIARSETTKQSLAKNGIAALPTVARNDMLRLKSAVANQVDKLWPEPKSSLMAGLLYGARSGLPTELLEDFNRSGITHIIAISGYNISIIALALMSFFILAGLSRPRAFWAVVVGIILFVLFTGASASVVRAGIMGVIVLLAQQMGRLSRVGNVLALTAALMLLFNPYVLVWDAGFQLSFLATLGLVYLSLGIASSLPAPRNDSINFFFQTLVQTLSAIIATLPLMLFQFGRLSIVAPLVNLLVLWIIPWLMLFGFAAVMLGFIFFPLGQIVAWIVGVGLGYVIMLVEWFGKQGWAALEIRISWWMTILLYIIIALPFIRGGLGRGKHL
ncbi:ComEC family competence protein [Patescibacteria group bacterium]|nr:MAG: ComEC family competence protein [Patescibacteria group bacterium]